MNRCNRSTLSGQAREIGFDAFGVTAQPSVHRTRTSQSFLANGEHGDMEWMATADRRSSRRLWQDVKSVIVLGRITDPTDPMDNLRQPDRGDISVYARNRDYHDLIKKRLKRLARWMVEEWGGEVKVFVDTAPVLEKPLAARTAAGWQGKHSNVVSRDYGSWLFLGEVFTTLDLPPDQPESDHCGSCRACLDICPTKAFPRPYQLDARRCISYLTIEHKGHIPDEFLEPIGNRIYGCDDCLAVCPWNKFASRTQEAAFVARDDLTLPNWQSLPPSMTRTFEAVSRGPQSNASAETGLCAMFSSPLEMRNSQGCYRSPVG